MSSLFPVHVALLLMGHDENENSRHVSFELIHEVSGCECWAVSCHIEIRRDFYSQCFKICKHLSIVPCVHPYRVCMECFYCATFDYTMKARNI